MNAESIATGSGATIALIGLAYALIRCFHHRRSKCISWCFSIDVSSDDSPPRDVAVAPAPEGTIIKKISAI